MATFKAVIFANRTAFEGRVGAIWNFYLAKMQNRGVKVDTDVVKSYSKGIDSLDDGKVLMQVTEEVEDFPWSPEQVVEVDTTDPKWFNQDPII